MKLLFFFAWFLDNYIAEKIRTIRRDERKKLKVNVPDDAGSCTRTRWVARRVTGSPVVRRAHVQVFGKWNIIKNFVDQKERKKKKQKSYKNLSFLCVYAEEKNVYS